MSSSRRMTHHGNFMAAFSTLRMVSLRRHMAFVLMFALGASSVFAQTLFKSTMPDGRVIYGEKPEPNAKKVNTLTVPAGKSGVTLVTPEEKARAEQRARNESVAGKATQKEV